MIATEVLIACGTLLAAILVLRLMILLQEIRSSVTRADGRETWLRDVSGVITKESRGLLLHTMVVDTRAEADGERMEIEYVADVERDCEALPAIAGNVGEINQVFLNLVVNAAHATESAVGDSGERGTITIGARDEGEHVRVWIADTGCGIPADIAPRVLDPFFTTEEVGRGSGHGLAIARTMVVERHGGSLTFETTPGRGTTFEVRLPVAAPEAAVAVAA